MDTRAQALSLVKSIAISVPGPAARPVALPLLPSFPTRGSTFTSGIERERVNNVLRITGDSYGETRFGLAGSSDTSAC